MANETIAKITNIHGEDGGSVFFDDGWDAFGWCTEGGTNGPFDTAEEAAAALADELEGKIDEKVLDAFVARCASYDERVA